MVQGTVGQVLRAARSLLGSDDEGRRHARRLRAEADDRRPPASASPTASRRPSTARSPRPRNSSAATTSSRSTISSRRIEWAEKMPCMDVGHRRGPSARHGRVARSASQRCCSPASSNTSPGPTAARAGGIDPPDRRRLRRGRGCAAGSLHARAGRLAARRRARSAGRVAEHRRRAGLRSIASGATAHEGTRRRLR